MAQKLAVKLDDGATVEVLATEISRISSGIRALRAGPLNERALLLLIQHAAPNPSGSRNDYKPLPVATIRRVLAGLDGLAAEYLKPKKK